MKLGEFFVTCLCQIWGFPNSSVCFCAFFAVPRYCKFFCLNVSLLATQSTEIIFCFRRKYFEFLNSRRAILFFLDINSILYQRTIYPHLLLKMLCLFFTKWLKFLVRERLLVISSLYHEFFSDVDPPWFLRREIRLVSQRNSHIGGGFPRICIPRLRVPLNSFRSEYRAESAKKSVQSIAWRVTCYNFFSTLHSYNWIENSLSRECPSHRINSSMMLFTPLSSLFHDSLVPI